MDQSLPGAVKGLVATALQFEISSRMCSKFRPREEGHLPRKEGHLLRSHLMDPSFPGAIQTVVATALQFEISFIMCSSIIDYCLDILTEWPVGTVRLDLLKEALMGSALCGRSMDILLSLMIYV